MMDERGEPVSATLDNKEGEAYHFGHRGLHEPSDMLALLLEAIQNNRDYLSGNGLTFWFNPGARVEIRYEGLVPWDVWVWNGKEWEKKPWWYR